MLLVALRKGIKHSAIAPTGREMQFQSHEFCHATLGRTKRRKQPTDAPIRPLSSFALTRPIAIVARVASRRAVSLQFIQRPPPPHRRPWKFRHVVVESLLYVHWLFGRSVFDTLSNQCVPGLPYQEEPGERRGERRGEGRRERGGERSARRRCDIRPDIRPDMR